MPGCRKRIVWEEEEETNGAMIGICCIADQLSQITTVMACLTVESLLSKTFIAVIS